jgi:hypothetical protein
MICVIFSRLALGLSGASVRRTGCSSGALVVEGVVPDLLHVVPIGDDTVLNWVLEGKNAALGLRFIADVRVFLAHAHHHALMTRTSDDRGEDRAGGVVAGESGLRTGKNGLRMAVGRRRNAATAGYLDHA